MEDALKGWLEEHGLDQYLALFTGNDVTFDDLQHLTEEDVRELGLPVGARRRFLVAIQSFAKAAPAPTAHGDTPTRPADKTQADKPQADKPQTHEPQAAQPAAAQPAARTASATQTPANEDAEHVNWSRHPDDRRPVTLLFADITGSTALTEQLDPEDAHAVLYGAVERMGAAVEGHRGTVCRFMGDGLMAMFGVPTAFEAHTRDALLAALDLQADIAAYTEELVARYGHGVQVRVGVHAGEVVALQVGDDGQSNWDASGPAVPIAARMEQSALPGTIQVTASTLESVAHFFDAEVLEPVSVKGISVPLEVRRLLGTADAAQSPDAQAQVPFVGRQLEAAQLEMAVRFVKEQGHGQVVVLRGEAGVGKTRLAQRAADHAHANGLDVHRVLVLDFGSGKGQSAVSSLVRSLLGISPGAAKELRAQKAQTAIETGLVEASKRMFVNDFLDLAQPPSLANELESMSPQLRRDGRRRFINELVEACAQRTPLLIIIEDLHWADEVTLLMLETLLMEVRTVPLLLLTTTRPTDDPFDNTWRESTRDLAVMQINLGPLKPQESQQLATELDVLDPARVAACIERSGGNPLFLVELLRSGASSTLPTSVQTLVATRLDQLGPQDRQAIQVAAVLGQRFDGKTVAGILEQDRYDVTPLLAAQFVKRDDNAYLFAHALVMEGVLNSMLRSTRQQLHLRAAHWFKDQDRVLYARHLERAESPDAARALFEAAREQVALVRFTVAVQLARDALALAPDSELQSSIHEIMADALLGLGDTHGASEAYAEALALTQDAKRRCGMLIKRARTQYTYGQYDAGLADLDKAAALATNVGEHINIEFQRGNIFVHLMDHDRCADAMRRAHELAIDSADPHLLALALGARARYEAMRGHIGGVGKYMRTCLELCERYTLPEVMGQFMHLASMAALWQGQLEQAMQHALRGIEVSSSIGNVRQGMIALSFATDVALMRGEIADADRFGREALRMANNIGEQGTLPQLQSRVAMAQFAGGARSEAVAFAKACLKDNVARNYSRIQLLGTLAILTWGTQTARDALDEANAIAQEPGFGTVILQYRREMIGAALEHDDLTEADYHGRELLAFVGDEVPPLVRFLCDWVEVSKAIRGSDASPEARSLLATTLAQAQTMKYAGAVQHLATLAQTS